MNVFHIALDNFHTAFKLSSRDFSYGGKAFNYMQFGFNTSGYIHCNLESLPGSELKCIIDESRFQEDEEESFISALIEKLF